MLTGDDLLNAVKEFRSNENSKSVTITKEQLNELWNAIEYTRGMIGNGCVIESTEKPDWVLIHKDRAHQSREFLNQAKDLVTQLIAELKSTVTSDELAQDLTNRPVEVLEFNGICRDNCQGTKISSLPGLPE